MLTVKKVFTRLMILFNCRVRNSHRWTCASMENIPPTREQLRGGPVGYWNYSQMYCKDCGKKDRIRIQANAN